MKKISLYTVFILGICLVFLSETTAAEIKCNYKTKSNLNSIAWNMVVDYAPTEKVIDDEIIEDVEPLTQYGFDLNVYNLTSDFYVEITNDTDEKIEKLYSTSIDKNGKATLNVKYTDQVVKYTFKIIANEQNCQGTLIRTINVTLPLRNEFYEMNTCEEIPDFYLCQKFVTKKTDYEKFLKKADEYKASLIATEEREENRTGFFGQLDKYKYIIIGVSIIGGGVAIFIVTKKRRSRVL